MDFNSENPIEEVHSRGRKDCCMNFWRGDAEIYTKKDFIPDWVVALYRVLALALSMYTLIRYYKLKFEFLTVWSLIGTCCAFFFGALSATTDYRIIKRVTVMLYYVFTSAALFCTVFYWSHGYGKNSDVDITWYSVYSHGISLALLVIDILFLSRMEFRLWYIALLIGYYVCYLAFMFIRLKFTNIYTYQHFDHRESARRMLIISYCTVISSAFGSGIVVILLSRMSRFLSVKGKNPTISKNMNNANTN